MSQSHNKRQGQGARWLNARHLAALAGRLLSLLALGFFVYVLAGQWSELGLEARWREALAICAGFGAAYALLLLLLAEQWHRLIAGFVTVPLARPATYFSLLSTQIAKYLPGNVFHFVGRHLVLSRSGAGNASLAKSLTWETALLILGALLVAVAGVLIAPTDALVIFLENNSLGLGWTAAGIFALMACLMLALAMLNRWEKAAHYTPDTRRTLICLALSSLFFLGQGWIFAGIVWALSGDIQTPLVGIAATAWIAGFVTPGAPGGVGIREAVMLVMLGAAATDPTLVLAIALFRIATAFGDLIWFGLANALWARNVEIPANS